LLTWDGKERFVECLRRKFWQVLSSLKVTNSTVLADILRPSLPGAFPLTVGEIFQKSLHTHRLACIPKNLFDMSKHSGIRVTLERAPQLFEMQGDGREDRHCRVRFCQRHFYIGIFFCPTKCSIKSSQNMPIPAVCSIHSCAYSSIALSSDK